MCDVHYGKDTQDLNSLRDYRLRCVDAFQLPMSKALKCMHADNSVIKKLNSRNIRRSHPVYEHSLHSLVDGREDDDVRPSEIADAHPLADDPMVRGPEGENTH